MGITHIGPDSEFVRFASEIFESVAPGADDYVIVAEPRKRLSFPPERGRAQVVSSGAYGAALIPAATRGSDMLIAHGMTAHSALAFAVAPRRTVKVWGGRGFDYYGTDDSPDAGLLGDATLELSATLRNNLDRSEPMETLRRKAFQPLVRAITHRAAARADYFSAIPEDFRILTARFPEFHGDNAQLNYSSVAGTFARNATLGSGADFLVGNSASFTNYHITERACS